MASTGIDVQAKKEDGTVRSKSFPYKISVRKSNDRGHANMDWLNTYHTFSFASYYDPKYEQFHSFRVLNEDRVKGGRGFGTHSHREYEIFSYVVSGALRHRDSMGNDESIPRGAVQFTSAGTGMSHSEHNASQNPRDVVHFLQLWVKPNVDGLKPTYQTRHFTDKEKENRLRLIVSPDGADDSVLIHQDVKVYASILSPGTTIELPLSNNSDHEYYIHVIQDVSGYDTELNQVALSLNSEHVLKGGDGAFITTSGKANDHVSLQIQGASRGDRPVEFIILDIKKGS